MPLKRRQRIYKNGSTGNDVKRLQYALKLKPDGIFGNNTEATLMLSKGIKEATQKQLDEIVSGTTAEHINIADSYVGKIKELDIDGDGDPDNRDPILDEMTKYVFEWYDPKDNEEGYPWCAIFISWVLYKAYEFEYKDARVRKWREYLQENGSKIDSKLDFYKDNIYIGLWLNQDGFGHIFFIDPMASFHLDDELVFTIEGNTNDGGSRDGDGVYRRKRNIYDFEMYRLNI